MTTLKLNKQPSEKPVARKAPLRRGDPSKRDRTIAPTQPSFKTQAKDKITPRADSASASNNISESSRQRNHRYDGKLREAASPPNSSAQTISAHETQMTKPDIRTSPSKSREEPHYRQAPKRHGKVRDGYNAVEPKAKAVNQPGSNSDLPRLSKVMAERGLCSRREADEWITNGWVKVDGKIVDTLGTRILPDADIVISGYAYEAQSEQVTILLHKPVGYVSGQAEDGYQPAVVLVHPDNQWEDDPEKKIFQRGFLKGLAPAGRLDIDSTGLLVLTQDGRIARHLIGEDSKVEKEYLVRVEGELSHEGLTKLNYGLSLDGVKLKPAKVSWQNEDQLRFVLREGRKRQIRRMCELVGLKVVGLKRIRIGSINLGKLPSGQWRYLQENERF